LTSPRSVTVNANKFGACLMLEPEHVQALAAAVRAAVPPDCLVSIKHRLGVDEARPPRPPRVLLCSALRAGGRMAPALEGCVRRAGGLL
jgi:tRNA-dihydrouridine synthase